MHDMDDETRKAVLGEALMDELKAIREYVEHVPQIKSKLNDIDDRLEVVETDGKTIKVVVKDISKRLHLHDQYITLLKQKIA